MIVWAIEHKVSRHWRSLHRRVLCLKLSRAAQDQDHGLGIGSWERREHQSSG